jgi:putative regulator of septum formation
MSATETTRTRLVMAGAFVGALMLLGLSMVFSWPVAVGGATSSAADDAARAFDSPSGTCLDWPAENPRAMRPLDCALPHVFEVTGNVEISKDYAPSAPPPDEKRWQEIAGDKCTAGVAAYLGGKLDPFGKYTVSALKPTDEQWRSGDRKLRCGLHRVTALGTRLRTKGSAHGQDQSNVYDIGTCFALKDKGSGDPTDCSKAHAVEIVGNADLSAAFPNGFPAPDAQATKLAELCGQAVGSYTGGLDLASKKLTLTWDTLQEQSWAAGSHKVDCKVGTMLEDGTGLGPVTGTVRGQGLPQPPPVTASTPGG